MKRFLLILMITILVISALPVLAGEPTEFEIPEVGTEINGFVVTDVSYWDSYATHVVKLDHEKTGSVLYWLANDNIDRSYMMAFHTIINDNTGMPHVFEHATLGGSEKYPGANTFFEMTAKTSNTFLNAMTGQTYTMYPMASTSEEQLLKFVDFYMSGLTAPLAVSNKYAMMREAYRYVLDDPDSEISLQGVVYSEMLGALNQSSWAVYNFERMIWPGSYVTTVSGGDPDYIPDLTLDAIREFHETYYHPSNATMYLTGDLDLPRFLELLDSEYLSKYDRAEIVIEDKNYTPLEPGYYEETFSYAVETGTSTDKAAIIYYGMPFEISDYNEMEILDYVCAYMNDESSPLQRMMREQLPEANGSMATWWEPEGKTSLVFQATGINESEKDKFKSICDEALLQLLENGVDEEVLHGILVSRQFEDLMGLDSSQVYLDVAENMTAYWTLFGDRDAWKLSRDFDNQLTELITVDNLNATARKYWPELDTAVMAITVPVPGLKEEKDAALRQKLDDMKASMTDEEIDALVAETRAYNAFVEESNAIIMPDELNALSVATLPEEVSYKEASETAIGGIRVITSEIDSPLIRVSIRTDTSAIPFEDLFDYIEFTSLLGTLGTDLYTREELPAKKAAVSYNMALYGNGSQDIETRALQNFFLAAWYALPETLEDSFALFEDILWHTDFSDYDYIRSDAAQTYSILQNYMDSNSLSFAVLASGSAYSDLAKYNYYVNTEAYMAYLKELSQKSDAEMDELVEKFEAIRKTILNKNGAILTVMANSENTLRAGALAYNVISKFDDAVLEPVDYTAQISDLPLHTGLVTGGNVVYNLSMTDMEAAGYDPDDGGLRVVRNLIDDKLLYPELRVKNSAYGSYALIYNRYIFGYYSYRDPEVAATYDVYETAGDFLRNLEIDEEELSGYITSVYGELTSPVGPLSAALSGISDKVTGDNSYERTLKMIRDIKAFKPEDIAKYADLAEAAGSTSASRATAGAKSMIEANADLFDYINYDLQDSGAAESDELLSVIESLSAEDIEEMLANMDENDLLSLVEFVMDYFTNAEGNVDYDAVFALVGDFITAEWTEEDIADAEEVLAEGSDAEASEEAESWANVWNSVFMSISEENIMNWIEAMTTGETEGYAQVLETEELLSNLLQGIFGAFVNSSAD